MRHGYTFLSRKVNNKAQCGSILFRLGQQVLISRSAGKVMAIIFCDIQGIILNHFVSPKTTVTGNYYASVIKSDLLPAIKRKRQQLMRSGILLHHDNVPSHSSRIVLDTIKELDIEILPHPDLAICDFWLFPNLKNRR